MPPPTIDVPALPNDREHLTVTIPSVMFLYMAIDMMKTRGLDETLREIKEFNMLGGRRMADILQKLPVDIVSPNADMLAGYLLGLETARVLLATMPKAVSAGIKL